jgi:hypothetical protein
MNFVKTLKTLKSEKGMTLIEVLAAAGLASITLLAVVSASDFMRKSLNSVDTKIAQDKMVGVLLNAITENFSQFQISFATTDLIADENEDTLPIAWSADELTDKINCPNCPGRIGYSITPLVKGTGTTTETIRGLFLVKARVTHKTLFPGEKRDYQFLVLGK